MRTYAVKVHNGRVLIFDARTGAQLRTVGSNVVAAQITGDLVQVTTADGRVVIYNAASGALQRYL